MALDFESWLHRLAPDVAATVRRFPVAVGAIVLATAAFLAVINDAPEPLDEFWPRLGLGLGTAAVFAVAGRLFAESRPGATVLTAILRYLVPLLAIGALQVRSTEWLFPMALPLVALLFLSVAPVLTTGVGTGRRAIEDRFWWINHRAVTTAVVAGVALFIVAAGIFAIERSLELLFSVRTGDLLYKWVLPIAAFLFTPVYWLSTIPHLADFDEKDLAEPDFLSRAIGFLGQFILSPLLVIYALILLAYGVQIVFTQRFPAGVLGWMVLVFVVTGAANWLVLHPEFMRARPLVALFRRFWFWLTIIPIALYLVAIWLRIDAYGMTAERVVLIAGGAWAVLLTLAFLVPRLCDIRLIPGLAAALLLAFSVGPWNFEQWPRLDQMGRLRTALDAAGQTGPGSALDWTSETGGQARASIAYLNRTDEGKSMLAALAAELGFEPIENTDAYAELFAVPSVSPQTPSGPTRLSREAGPVDVAATPTLLTRVVLGSGTVEIHPGLDLSLSDEGLVLNDGRPDRRVIALTPWLARQSGSTLADPVLLFSLGERRYALVVDEVNLAAVYRRAAPNGDRPTTTPAAPGGSRHIVYLDAILFADAAP